jgi:hypothetical protein
MLLIQNFFKAGTLYRKQSWCCALHRLMEARVFWFLHGLCEPIYNPFVFIIIIIPDNIIIHRRTANPLLNLFSLILSLSAAALALSASCLGLLSSSSSIESIVVTAHHRQWIQAQFK